MTAPTTESNIVPDPRDAARTLIEQQIEVTTKRDLFTAAEMQDFLFELYAALRDEPEPEPALAQ